MQQTAFEKGDTVRLKPGGQEMTVSSVDRTGVGCKWLPGAHVVRSSGYSSRSFSST